MNKESLVEAGFVRHVAHQQGQWLNSANVMFQKLVRRDTWKLLFVNVFEYEYGGRISYEADCQMELPGESGTLNIKLLASDKTPDAVVEFFIRLHDSIGALPYDHDELNIEVGG